MMKKILYIIMLAFATVAQAQTKVEGEVMYGAGYGETNAFLLGGKLKINTGKFTIKPYLNLSSVKPYNATELHSMDLVYTSSGNHYTQEQETEKNEHRVGYGTELQYRLDDRNIFQASVDGIHSDRTITGERTEYLYNPEGSLLSSVKSVLSTPKLYRNEVNVQASYLHKTNREGESLLFKYNYSLDKDEDNFLQELEETTGFSPEMYRLNLITSDIKIQRHEVLFDWKRPLVEGHLLNVGAKYSNNFIHTYDGQWLDDFEFNNSEFRHRTQTAGVYAGYSLKEGAIEADARVEYDYTRMNEKNLHDVIPQARFAYHIDDKNTLTASYAMRIVRPTLQYLYDDRVKGPYTLDFGNEDLEGIHVNRVALAYELKTKKVDFTTTVAHTNVTDGFNAIWMEIENVRVSTWGNEAVRKAIEITPEVLWRASERTKLKGSVTVLWDERIAYAIDMYNPNWGVTGRAGWEQQLPLGFKLGVDAMVSKGNTLDVYSHEGLNYVFGGNLERSFLNNKLTATLAYEYKKLPVIEITQGAYTGSIYTRDHNPNMVKLALSYKF
jgi:hypothetical protein